MVAFKPLTPEIIRQVVQKFVMQLEAQLADRNVTDRDLATTPPTGWPRTASTSSTAPGPLARVIQEHIKKPLADEILFGKLVQGGHVKVVLKDGKIDLRDREQSEKPGKAPKSEDEPNRPWPSRLVAAARHERPGAIRASLLFKLADHDGQNENARLG